MGQGTISGSFSGANNAVKHNFRKYGRHMLRTVVQYHAYTLTIDIDALHPALMRRLNKVFVALDSNDVNRARREVSSYRRRHLYM